MEKEGKTGSYLSRFKKVLNSWLSYYGINVKLKVNIRGESDTLRMANEMGVGRELIADKAIEVFEAELKKLREGKHNPQRTVNEEELEKYLAEGWRFLSILPSKRVLIVKEQVPILYTHKLIIFGAIVQGGFT